MTVTSLLKVLFINPAINNYSRGVQLHGNYAYFIGQKGNVQRFDVPSLIRIADTKRSYRSESQPTGTIVDFCVTAKDRIVSLAEFGIITVVEGCRSVKQTGRLSENDVYSCVAWIDDKILVASYNPGQRYNNFRLLGPDMRDLPGHIIEDTSKVMLTRLHNSSNESLQEKRNPPCNSL